MKKTLMIAAAALALTAGAASFNATPAEAGKFSLNIHVGGYGSSYHGGYYGGGCYTKYKKFKIKYWNGWHWKYKWVSKPVKICY